MAPPLRLLQQLLPLALLVVVAVPWEGALGLSRIDAPCSACQAIASELAQRIEEEPTRNHLDLRHRLDSSGQRYGKVIDYKVSELRAVELLENLCGSLTKKWTLVTVESTSNGSGAKRKTVHWERTVDAAAASRPDSQEEEVRQKQLTSFCGSVLDEYDEELTDAIKDGVLEQKGASQWLCHDLVAACPVGSEGSTGSKVLARKGALPETTDGTTSAAVAAAAAAEAAKQPLLPTPPPPPPPPLPKQVQQEIKQEVKLPGLDDAEFQSAALREAAKVADSMGLKIDGFNDPATEKKKKEREERRRKKKAAQKKAEL